MDKYTQVTTLVTTCHVYMYNIKDKLGEVIYPFPHASSGPHVFSVIIPLHETEITYGYLYKDRNELSPLDRKLVGYLHLESSFTAKLIYSGPAGIHRTLFCSWSTVVII